VHVRYYAPNGAPDHLRFTADGYCENGTRSPPGKAAVTGARGARFYWFGLWTVLKTAKKRPFKPTTDSLTRETYQDGLSKWRPLRAAAPRGTTTL
jgi:hypothetical protein